MDKCFNSDGKYDCVNVDLFARLVQKKGARKATHRGYRFGPRLNFYNGEFGLVTVVHAKPTEFDTAYFINPEIFGIKKL